MFRENLTLPSLGNLFLNWSCIALDCFCLALGVLKAKKCKKRCIGFKGSCCQIFFFSKAHVFVLAITWPFESKLDDSNLRWCIRIMDENL